MGILFFIYLNSLTLFSAFSKKKLYILNNSAQFNIANKYYLQYNFFFNFKNISLKKINFFKKKNSLNIFFLDDTLSKCFDQLIGFNFLAEKKNFFIFNFLIFFFNKNLFSNILDLFFKKKNLKHLYFIFIQIFLSLITLKKNNIINISFLNFSKLFDFLFFKNIIFNKNQKYKYMVFNFINNSDKIISYANNTFNKKVLLSQINKYALLNFNNKLNLKVLDMSQYLFLLNSFFSKNKKFFFLRNNEIYNKSRYSRNRQTYKTGVFWCIWLTVLTVIGLYFYFYIFLIKFTYLWVMLLVLLSSFFLYYFRSKIEKHIYF